jgi:hypothetical protein
MSGKKNGLGKLYDRLTPEERFRLDVLAMARGDAEESEFLTRTCPRHTYTMNDVGFAGRWQAAKELTTLTYMDIAGKVEKLRLIEAFGVIVSAYSELLEREAGDGPPADEEHEGVQVLAREMPERTEELEHSIAISALTVWAAFRGFCAEEMGLEAEALLGALAEPMVERVWELEEIAERLKVEPDLEMVAECAAALRENWQRQLAKG